MHILTSIFFLIFLQCITFTLKSEKYLVNDTSHDVTIKYWYGLRDNRFSYKKLECKESTKIPDEVVYITIKDNQVQDATGSLV